MAEIPGDNLEREPVLAALFDGPPAASARSDDWEDQLAYDGLDGPEKRPLGPDERALLHRVIGMVSGHPAWRTEGVVRRAEIGAALGDGTQSLARDLTARERDDLCWMVRLVTAEFRDQHRGPGREPRYNGTLTSGDVTRLNLIVEVIDPRAGYHAPPLRVNAEDWARPATVPDEWRVACARRPLDAPVTWQGADTGNGEFYAAVPPDMGTDSRGWDPSDPGDGSRWVLDASNGQISDIVYVYVAQYGCRSPGEAGLTVAEAARDLGWPWRAATELGDGDDVAVHHLRWTNPAEAVTWCTVHGSRSSAAMAARVAAEGLDVAETAVPDLSRAPARAQELHAVALAHGWDAIYVPASAGSKPRPDVSMSLAALNPDTKRLVDWEWIGGKGAPASPGFAEPLYRYLETIRNNPRARFAPGLLAHYAAVFYPGAVPLRSVPRRRSGPGRAFAPAPDRVDGMRQAPGAPRPVDPSWPATAAAGLDANVSRQAPSGSHQPGSRPRGQGNPRTGRGPLSGQAQQRPFRSYRTGIAGRRTAGRNLSSRP